jgi:hypothetical protein
MRKRKWKPRLSRRRVLVTQRRFADDDPPFDERELEFYASGDEKIKPPGD